MTEPTLPIVVQELFTRKWNADTTITVTRRSYSDAASDTRLAVIRVVAERHLGFYEGMPYAARAFVDQAEFLWDAMSETERDGLMRYLATEAERLAQRELDVDDDE